MPTCPKGHQSVATDYCDECGSPIGGVTTAPPPAPVAAAPAAQACPSCGAARTGRFCEVCGHDFVLGEAAEVPAEAPPPPSEATGGADGVPVAPDGTPIPPDGARPAAAAQVPPVVPVGDAGTLAGELPPRTGVTAGWRVVAAADRDHHARMQTIAMPDAPPIPFPEFCPERRFSLRPGQVLIGRRRPSRGIEPDIDLTGPPEDAAVSHAHAMLVSDADGGWSVVDLDSANGTYLNDAPEALRPHIPIPLTSGDRIHVGAWTTLTVVHEGGTGAA